MNSSRLSDILKN